MHECIRKNGTNHISFALVVCAYLFGMELAVRLYPDIEQMRISVDRRVRAVAHPLFSGNYQT